MITPGIQDNPQIQANRANQLLAFDRGQYAVISYNIFKNFSTLTYFYSAF